MVRGRADDVIISGGEKIVAGEVEQVLRGCPQVREAVVVGAPDPDWGERVTVMIVAADEAAPPSLADLRAYARDRLPRYAAPQAVVVVGELPMLASGKPDRQLIREMAAGRRRLRAAPEAAALKRTFRHARAARETKRPVARYT